MTRSRRLRTPTTTLVASLVAAFALAAVGSLAAAAEPADAYYLKSGAYSKWKYGDTHLNDIRFPPRNPGFRPCITRSVKLPGGRYWHGAYLVHVKHRTNPDLYERPITIQIPGRYKWVVCRGWRGGRDGNYEIRTTLTGHGFHHSFVNPIEPYVDALNPTPVRYGNGKYEWGGRLADRCPECTHPSH